ncbi:hypothetical protein DFP72DRAFT_885901, partial [Ephemerocybe angulata]
MLFNATKSVVMIFGRQPTVVPVFDLGDGGALSVVKEHTYLGFRLSSKGSGMLRPHYDAKAATAQTMRRVIGGVGQMAGTLPVGMLVMLYMALIDPHLVHGCEVVIDEVKAAYEKLEKVHKVFIRKAIGLTRYSLLAVLCTETGLEPLAYRRVLLAVGYLLYALRTKCLYVRCAVQEAVDLDRRGYPSWASSLRTAVRALEGGGDIDFPDAGELLSEGRVIRLEADILRRMDQYLHAKVEGTDRLSLLHGRKEDDGKGGEVVVVRKLRHYLRVYNPGHRKALARVLLSDHRLATRVRRYTGGEEEQKCRFCRGEEESVAHVWLECGGRQELVERREEYVRQVLGVCSELERERLFALDATPFQQVKYLAGLRCAVTVTAAYAYDVERMVKAIERGGGEGESEEGDEVEE